MSEEYIVDPITSLNSGTILNGILHSEILEESTLSDFNGINIQGTKYTFLKTSAWSSTHEDTLDFIVTTHTGTEPSGGDDVSIQTAVKLQDPGSGTKEITLIAPDPTSSDYTITLPANVGNSGQILKTVNTSGKLGWVDEEGANAIHENVASEISAITAKGIPITADFLLIEDSADSNNKKRITIGDLPSMSANVFGNDYQTAISLNRQTTNSSSFQNKLTLTTESLTGTYRIGWTSVVDQSNTGDSVEVRLYNQTDTVTVGVIQRKEPKDTDNRTMAGGFAEVEFTGSAKEFRIQWREQDGSTAGIQDARIEIWRLS